MLYQIKCDYSCNLAAYAVMVKSSTPPNMQQINDFMHDTHGDHVVYFDLSTLSCTEVAVINFD